MPKASGFHAAVMTYALQCMLNTLIHALFTGRQSDQLVSVPLVRPSVCLSEQQ